MLDAQPKKNGQGGFYASKSKARYRTAIWRNFAGYYLRGAGRMLRGRIAILPSYELTEIEVALKWGFHLDKLLLVDRDREVVRHIKERYPDAVTFRGDSSAGMRATACRGKRRSC